MQRILGSHVFLLMFIGSYAWTNSIPSGEAHDAMRRLMFHGNSPRRFQVYDYGRRPVGEEQGSLEDYQGVPSAALDYCNELEKRASGNMYAFGLGKRSRTYGFGLGKRLEQAWKNSAAPLAPGYRQERRSKIYSFGLGERGGVASSDSVLEDYEEGLQQGAEKNSRQFSFGLGKREVDAGTIEKTTS